MNSKIPLRGEVWRVNFDPTIGAEIRKTRPAVVVSSDGIGRLPLKLVASITEWKEAFADCAWLVRIEVRAENGLSKTSAVDALQLRGMDFQRFVNCMGQLTQEEMDEVAAAIAIVAELK